MKSRYALIAKLIAPLRPFFAIVLALSLLSPTCVLGQSAAPPAPRPKIIDELAPLPQDEGRAGLEEMLKRLHTTARLLHTVAHPDDEDGGMLTLESRGHGDDVTLMTLTHGEGGQNKTGSNLFDELGVLRVLELLKSDQYYGVHQRFSMAADFGFSKTAEESLEKWKDGGPPGYIPLRDMVRVIRTFRPDVIAQRFQGAPRDGHGHHQASGIITREAFRDAADPNKFPELHLPPWQAKKLYMDNVHEGEDYTVAFDTGQYDPALGMSYIQFAMMGLKHQLSQGAGQWKVEPGPHLSRYKLIDSVLPPLPPGAHENDFFNGIDTSLPGLADRLGDDETKVPWLKPALQQVAQLIDQATAAEKKDMESAAVPLSEACQDLKKLQSRVAASNLDPALKDNLNIRLAQKNREAEHAILLALALNVTATTTAKDAAQPFARPGELLSVDISTLNGSSAPLKIEAASQGGMAENRESGNLQTQTKSGEVLPHQDLHLAMQVIAPREITKPAFHRENPEVDSVYESSAPDPTIPFSAEQPHIVLKFSGTLQGRPLSGQTEVPVETAVNQPDGTLRLRPLAIAPKFSVLIDPSTQVIPTSATEPRTITVQLRSIAEGPAQGTLKLTVPAGWKVAPASEDVNFAHYGDERNLKFEVTPGNLSEKRSKILATFASDGKSYEEGYTTVERPDLGTYYYYQPSIQKISEVNLKIEPGLKVGYIMGAGDDIPTVLRQVAVNVSEISPEELASGNLSQYGTIVIGIRAYDTRDDVKKYNPRLLDYVKNGGTLIVQYNTAVAEFNGVALPPQTSPIPPKPDPNSPIPGKFTPYPAELSHDRVTLEQAPVTILEPNNPVFHYPNQITEADFDGWVQERGLYFMDRWAPEFHALLSCHDPNEPGRKGGLLEAQYGKGTYIYTGYAFFRQLPVGVPGAVRLFVNLLSAGHEPH